MMLDDTHALLKIELVVQIIILTWRSPVCHTIRFLSSKENGATRQLFNNKASSRIMITRYYVSIISSSSYVEWFAIAYCNTSTTEHVSSSSVCYFWLSKADYPMVVSVNALTVFGDRTWVHHRSCSGKMNWNTIGAHSHDEILFI